MVRAIGISSSARKEDYAKPHDVRIGKTFA